MRPVPSILLASLACLSPAQRLLDVPSAISLQPREFKLETFFERNGNREQSTRVGLGLAPGFDAHLRWGRLAPRPIQATLDLSYAIARPLRGFGPGIAVGVMDALDTTRDRTRGYLVLSHLEEGVDDVTNPVSAEVVAGLSFGRHVSPLTGARIPLGPRLEAIAEYDGFRPAGGLKWLPVPGFYAGAFIRENRTLLALAGQIRF
jgi:hypothetical protein